MGAGSIFLSILALSATVIHAAPPAHALSSSHHVTQYKVPTHAHSSAAKAPTKVHHAISYKTPTHGASSKKATKAPTGKHHSSAAKPASAQPGNAKQKSVYAADASMMKSGPPTTLDAVQAQASKNLASIAAGGQKLHASGVASVASASKAAFTAAANCNDGSWALTIQNYNNASVDKNIQTWWAGGKDTDGITYPAHAGHGLLTEDLAVSFEPVGSDLSCTLEAHACQPAPDCNNYRVNLAGGLTAHPSHWGWFAIHSIANLYSFSASFQQGLNQAGIEIALLNLDLTQTFTKPTANQDVLTRDLLLGFSFVAIAAFIFVPVAGPVLASGLATALDVVGATGVTAAIAVSDAGSFLGNSLIDGATLDSKASDFGAYLASIFNSTAAAIDTLVSDMMAGKTINNPAGTTPTLFNIMDGGGWVNAEVVTNPNVSVTQIQKLLQKDLIQRGINAVWGKSKIWVSFANLNDDASQSKCKADKNGWQASKTCADGGVYYLYRFNENGDHSGYLDYPWGADKMAGAPWYLSPAAVTSSSAQAYRSQNNGAGGFAYDYTKAPTNLPSVFEAVGHGSLDDLNILEGVWNISVCDMGTHSDWNTDFTQSNPSSTYGFMAFPCCCGPQCSQTAAFIESAQMENFDTVISACQTQLGPCSAWPAGVTEIDYGQAGKITKQNFGGSLCVMPPS